MNKVSAFQLAEAIYAAYALALERKELSVADHLLRGLELLASQSGDTTYLDSAYELIEPSNTQATHIPSASKHSKR